MKARAVEWCVSHAEFASGVAVRVSGQVRAGREVAWAERWLTRELLEGPVGEFALLRLMDDIEVSLS